MYCGVELDEYWHVDHLYPKSRGGCYSCIENLMPSCPECNRSKSYYSLEEWRQRIGDALPAWWEVKVKFWFEDKSEHVVWQDRNLVMAVNPERYDYLLSKAEKMDWLGML